MVLNYLRRGCYSLMDVPLFIVFTVHNLLCPCVSNNLLPLKKKWYFLLVVKNKSERFTYFYFVLVRKSLYFNAAMSKKTQNVLSVIIKESSRG